MTTEHFSYLILVKNFRVLKVETQEHYCVYLKALDLLEHIFTIILESTVAKNMQDKIIWQDIAMYVFTVKSNSFGHLIKTVVSCSHCSPYSGSHGIIMSQTVSLLIDGSVSSNTIGN